MTQSQFIKVKLTAHKPEFKNMIGLTTSNKVKTSDLIDFCRMMHPNCALDAQGSVCNVHTNKSHFIYTMYTTCIIKTNVYISSKLMYNL